jgi:mannose-1-phosphate guanylyltransferase
MMADDFYAMIMAGGGGTRLWPLSRRAKPKQQLQLIGERSLFQRTVDRLLPIMAAEHIIVATIAEQVDALQAQAPMLPSSSFLIEPEPKGTASIVGLGAAVLQSRHGDVIMACLPADHYIEDEDRFRECLLAAHKLAGDGNLVTLGITPTYAATGYGYIHFGERIGKKRGFETFVVRSFTEKPSSGRAERYIAEGGYAWNSGMFIWRTDSILEEIARQMPALHEGAVQIVRSMGGAEEKTTMQEVWRSLRNQTIDYGIMEGARKVAMVAADELGWCDIGGWSGLTDVMKEDENRNLILADHAIVIDSEGSLLFQEAAGQDRLVALLGVSDLIVVDTGDAVLVCPRERAEEVRRIVETLKNEGKSRYL